MKGKYHQKEISALLEFRECSSKAKKKKKKGSALSTGFPQHIH